jgi:hypothetical protein
LLLGPPDTRFPNPEELPRGQGVEELVGCGERLLKPGIDKGSFRRILSGPSRP